jgi:hypothetical protein
LAIPTTGGILLKVDALVILGLATVATALLGFGAVVVAKWRGVPVRHVIQPSIRTEWHDRLDELNYLLARVQASDSTLAQLPTDLVAKLSKYFGDRLRPPAIPRENDDVIRRVMLLEDWLGEVQNARITHQTLPQEVAGQVDKYLKERQRRLGQ